jgi:HSF-type DNA-binding
MSMTTFGDPDFYSFVKSVEDLLEETELQTRDVCINSQTTDISTSNFLHQPQSSSQSASMLCVDYTMSTRSNWNLLLNNCIHSKRLDDSDKLGLKCTGNNCENIGLSSCSPYQECVNGTSKASNGRDSTTEDSLSHALNHYTGLATVQTQNHCEANKTTLKGTKGQGETKIATQNSSKAFCTFPLQLFKLLKDSENELFTDIVSWLPHGKAFRVHKPNQFVAIILPRYFRQTVFPSFQRQLALYGFRRIPYGMDRAAYYHEFFIKGCDNMCHNIKRTPIKGTISQPYVKRRPMPNFSSYPMDK